MADKKINEFPLLASAQHTDVLLVESEDVTYGMTIATLSEAIEDDVVLNKVYNGLDKNVAGFALDARQGKALNEAIQGKQSTLTFDSTPTANSTNPVTSGGVKAALDAKLDSASVYNGLDKTVAGAALDARQGKVLNDKIQQYGVVVSVSDNTLQISNLT